MRWVIFTFLIASMVGALTGGLMFLTAFVIFRRRMQTIGPA